MAHPDVLRAEMQRADALLAALAGEAVDTLTVNSIDVEDAPFLGQIVSKLSPMIGNLLEKRITKALDDKEALNGLEWVRQDPGFPDALLLDETGASTENGYEVKAWYAMSTELTGRFRESVNLLEPRNVRVVIVAWAMSHIVYGTPQILDVLTVDAIDVARSRDTHYWDPPRYLTVEPGDTSARTINLQQSNVNGYRLQETDAEKLAAAHQLVSERAGEIGLPHTTEAQALAQELMAGYSYRLDTNFAKVDRVDNPDIEAFKARVLASKFRNLPVADWARVLRDLNSPNVAKSDAAAHVIKSLYDVL